MEALRRAGVNASPAEVIDAARAVEAVGLDDRARFRAALRTTLAKGVRPREAFDHVFDSFFAPPSLGAGKKGEKPTGAGGGGVRVLGVSPGSGVARPRSDRELSRAEGEGRRPATSPRDRSSREGTERVRALLEATRSGAERRRGRLRVVLRAARWEEPSREGARGPARIERQALAGAMTTDQERALARAIPKVIEEIRLRRGRRLRRAREGRLWLRRVFRENVAHGGTPFVLPFRRSRPRRPKVVLLLDVSFSVARAAGFFLWIASEFLHVGRETRIVAFVDRPVDATAALGRWLRRRNFASGIPSAVRSQSASPGRVVGKRRSPGEGIRPAAQSFADALEGLSGLNLEAPSDYGRAFHRVLESSLIPGSRDTVLVILGDGRTNRLDPLPWTLEEIARRCRTVLWLVPEPQERWGSEDSALGHYLSFVDVAVEAHDLEGLARGVAEILRRL